MTKDEPEPKKVSLQKKRDPKTPGWKRIARKAEADPWCVKERSWRI
jgi:hypothetical protein